MSLEESEDVQILSFSDRSLAPSGDLRKLFGAAIYGGVTHKKW